MTIGQLKRLIKNLPDEIKIVTEGSDHCYEEISRAEKLVALFSKQMGYSEYYGEELTPKLDSEECVEVFFINCC